MDDTVRVRRAVPGDAGVLSRIALEAKGYWKYPKSWLESWRGDLTLTPGFIRRNEVRVAVSDGGPTGFYALVGEGGCLDLEHLWVSPGHMGTGLGRALFKHAMRRATAMGAGFVEIESDPNAEGFYRKMGAVRVGENAYEIEGQRRVLPVLTVDLSAGVPTGRA